MKHWRLTAISILLALALCTNNFQYVFEIPPDTPVPSETTSIPQYFSGPMGLQVNTFAGSLYYTRSDLSIPARHLPINLGMFYSTSLAETDLGYGFGWQFTYNDFYQLDPANPNLRVVFLGSGESMRFQRQGANYVAEAGGAAPVPR